jgi:hypothetical protein
VPAELVDERKRGLVRRLNRSCVDPWEHIPLPSVFFLPIRGAISSDAFLPSAVLHIRCTCAMCQSVGAALL